MTVPEGKPTRWEPGTIVLCQGVWRCRVVEDKGASLTYIALEGFEPTYRGTPLSAAKDLFSEIEDKHCDQ